MRAENEMDNSTPPSCCHANRDSADAVVLAGPDGVLRSSGANADGRNGARNDAVRTACVAGMFRKPRPVEGFLLRDAQGKEVTHRTLAGDKTLLLFAYPKCETRCPVTLAQAKEIAKHVRVLVVCADPDETPEGITAWAERTGLQCVRGETMELMHSFRQYGTGAADHPADFFLLDEQVRWVGHWPHPADTAAVIEAVK